MRCSVLQRLLFGPGHLDSAMVLGAAAAWPLSLPISLVIVVGADAGQPEHGVTIFHQLGLSSDTQVLFHTFVFFFHLSFGTTLLSLSLFRVLFPTSTPKLKNTPIDKNEVV